MKLVTIVLLPNFDIKQVGEKKTTKYVFNAMETDLNGARIPTELQTFNEDIDNLEKRITSLVSVINQKSKEYQNI